MLCMHSPGGYINREQIMNLPCQLDENDKRKKNHVRKVKRVSFRITQARIITPQHSSINQFAYT
jgi:hypothetical protein